MTRRRPTTRAVLNRIGGTVAGALGGQARSPAELKRQADMARARRDWASDVYFRRQICAVDETRLGAWIQYGHALKEAGFHALSEAAYRRAMTLQPESAEISLQLGHLLKVRGDLAGAISSFQTADGRGHPDKDEITRQLTLLRRVDSGTVYRDAVSGIAKSGVRYFLSVPSGQVREGSKSEAASGLGRTDYSYSFAMRGFAEALEALELDYAVIDNPEFISDIRERSSAEVNIHLGFYPPERLRVLKGAYNINCFAWEFDRLRTSGEVVSYHAFADQSTMLARVDEIWTPSEHGSRAVRAGVDQPVETVPAPILSNLGKHPRAAAPGARDVQRATRGLTEVSWEPLAIVPRIQPTLDGAARARRASLASLVSQRNDARPKIFLSVFNVHDFRKQIEPLITGFMRFAETDESALLLLKVTSPDRHKESANAFVMKDQVFSAARLVPPMVSDRIWMTHDVLTREELNRLYDAASFYVCTSYAEGQNLPLLEAMGRGVVPLSVSHTAMSDYVDEDDAVIIPSHSRPLDVRLAARYGMFGLETNFVDAEDVMTSLHEACGLDDATYAAKSSRAMQIVKDRFGLAPFAERVSTLAGRLQSERSGT